MPSRFRPIGASAGLKRLVLLLTLWVAGGGVGRCDPPEEQEAAEVQGQPASPSSEARRLLEVRLPPLACRGLTLVEALRRVNRQLADAAVELRRREVVVVRHDQPGLDNGGRLLDADLPGSSLGERLDYLGKMSFTHWKLSDGERFVVFLTWHRPQYDPDSGAGSGLLGGEVEGRPAVMPCAKAGGPVDSIGD